MKKKLLLVGAFPPPDSHIFGGIVTTCQVLLNSSFSEHYELVLIDSTQVSHPVPSIGIRALLALRRFARFSRSLFSQDVNLVIIFISGAYASVLEKGVMAWLAKFNKKPVLLFPRGGRIIESANVSLFHKLWIKAMMRGGSHILCQGQAWQQFSIDVLGFSRNDTTIVKNWTACSSLLNIGEQRTWGGAEEKTTLLFLGWLEVNKGIFELLQAVLALSRTYDFRLIIAGRGNAEESARDFVEQNKLHEIVEFAGWVEGDAKHSILAQSDILVLPSWSEGFPNAIIEAMAAKVAVIVTEVGNIPGIITDENQALLVPPRDIELLRQAIERLLLDTSFRLQLAERGYVYACENFSIEPAVQKLSRIIESFT